MKKSFISVLFVLCLSITSVFAIPNPIKEFADGIAYSTFKTAWPTAKYSDIEVLEYEETSSGYDIVLKFKGNSRVCFVGTCPLWFKLEVLTDSSFIVKNMKVLEHNAKLAEPFATSGSIAKAMLDANSR